MPFENIFSSRKTKKEVKHKIIADFREKNSLLISELVKLGIEVEFRHLEVGDYLVNNAAIERKTIQDLKNSIIDKRIFSQLENLQKYPDKFILLEGFESENPYSGNLHENAFRGFIISAIQKSKVPIIFTLNEKDSAKYITLLAKKTTSSENPMRISRTAKSDKEKIQFVLEGFPKIGPSTAKKIITRYKTFKNFINSSEEELTNLIGEKGKEIYRLIILPLN